LKILTWRNTALVLALVCGAQRFTACRHRHHAPPAAETDVTDDEPRPSRPGRIANLVAPIVGLPTTPPPPKPTTFHGIKIPPGVAHFLPQPGEKLRAYRDRMLPLAEIARAPQRARVARARDELSLAPAQRAELDATVTDTMTAIENRVMAGIASGELDSRSLTPIGGIAVARDILDAIDRGNARFQKSLTDDQRTALAPLHFDFADYLVFSAPWEDALKFLD
jgi:hypothetical protein